MYFVMHAGGALTVYGVWNIETMCNIEIFFNVALLSVQLAIACFFIIVTNWQATAYVKYRLSNRTIE